MIKAWGASVLLTFAMFAWLLFNQSLMSSRLQKLDRYDTIRRATLPGRTESEVVSYLGKPDRVDKASSSNKRYAYSIRYHSSPPGERLNDTDDLWIALNAEHKVVLVLFPDYPQERKILETIDAK